MTDGEREVRAEAERDAREYEEAARAAWATCPDCGGSGLEDGVIDEESSDIPLCEACYGLGSVRDFGHEVRPEEVEWPGCDFADDYRR